MIGCVWGQKVCSRDSRGGEKDGEIEINPNNSMSTTLWVGLRYSIRWMKVLYFFLLRECEVIIFIKVLEVKRKSKGKVIT